jgi:chromosome segregation ATPase
MDRDDRIDEIMSQLDDKEREQKFLEMESYGLETAINILKNHNDRITSEMQDLEDAIEDLNIDLEELQNE